jgi:hypothetical protein
MGEHLLEALVETGGQDDGTQDDGGQDQEQELIGKQVREGI